MEKLFNKFHEYNKQLIDAVSSECDNHYSIIPEVNPVSPEFTPALWVIQGSFCWITLASLFNNVNHMLVLINTPITSCINQNIT